MVCRCRSGECDPECDGPELRAEIGRLQALLAKDKPLLLAAADEIERLQAKLAEMTKRFQYAEQVILSQARRGGDV
jgi:hypothetical protein